MRLEQLAERIVKASDGKRYLVAIAGPPGAGKSTIAKGLLSEISQNHGSQLAQIVPMDGFHLDNAVLKQRGLFERKGAPDTFDADGFIRLAREIRAAQSDVPVPGFNRAEDKTIANMFTLQRNIPIILMEGNYLLLESAPWSQLKPMFDLTVFINPGINVLKERLVQRWLNHGMPPKQALNRALQNDIPNAQTVLDHSAKADINLTA